MSKCCPELIDTVKLSKQDFIDTYINEAHIISMLMINRLYNKNLEIDIEKENIINKFYDDYLIQFNEE